MLRWPNEVPVDDTIARIISALSVRGCKACFRRWIGDVITLSEGGIVAVNGTRSLTVP